LDRPGGTGVLIGFAFGVAASTLLLFRFGGYFLFLPFAGFAPIVIGPVIGFLLGRAGAVPYVRTAHMIASALIIASAPLVTGTVETRLRDAPFPIPADADAVHWEKYPWGERVLRFGSTDVVPAFFDRLVKAATEENWTCRSCVYQPSTGTGHASFKPTEKAARGSGGYLGFEVWPGEMALYGSEKSELSQVRIFHSQPTRSPVYAMIIVSVLLVVAVLLHVIRKGNR